MVTAAAGWLNGLLGDLKPCEALGPSAAGVTQAVSLALTDNPGYGYCNVYPSIVFLYCISMVIYI